MKSRTGKIYFDYRSALYWLLGVLAVLSFILWYAISSGKIVQIEIEHHRIYWIRGNYTNEVKLNSDEKYYVIDYYFEKDDYIYVIESSSGEKFELKGEPPTIEFERFITLSDLFWSTQIICFSCGAESVLYNDPGSKSAAKLKSP